MTQEELNAAISEIIVAQEKFKSTGNSHKRKQWENRRNWRLCTVGETCKLGSFKDYDALYKFYDENFPQWISWVRWLSGPGGIFAGVHYCKRRRHFCRYSFNNKWLRNFAERVVRRYKGEISNGSMYRKIFDYQWGCI
ncbi:MAG: hypothetical protein IJT73_03100 [Selenomonadaceae bacterium]|nr:hypothetical protein [Selenomonadaceae bacterium]